MVSFKFHFTTQSYIRVKRGSKKGTNKSKFFFLLMAADANTYTRSSTKALRICGFVSVDFSAISRMQRILVVHG